MTTSLFSSSWYRVADLKPRLRAHTAVHRQVFRGKIWYVLQDHQTGRFHRLSPIANLMLCLMDGRRTMRDIWEAAGRKAKDDPPTQDETIHLLAQLHAADLLQGEIPPDFDEMAERSEKADQRRLMQRIAQPAGAAGSAVRSRSVAQPYVAVGAADFHTSTDSWLGSRWS